MRLPLRFALAALALAAPAHLAAQPDPRLRRADSLDARAEALGAAGQFAEAAALAREELALREAALGPDHPDVARSLNGLGRFLIAQGDYAVARPLVERSLVLREAAFGPDHPEVAKSLNNLGVLYLAQGDLGAARPYFERVLVLREAALGPHHLDVAKSAYNLAGLLLQQGDYGAARPLLERTLRTFERVLGPHHLDLGEVLSDLALAYMALHEFEAAHPILERALAIREAALGPEHPLVAQSLGDLGVLHRARGDFAAAVSLYERAVTLQERARGPQHLGLAISLNNLGLTHVARGDYVAARPALERALAIQEAALGPEHPMVAVALGSLALALHPPGTGGSDPTRARRLLLRAARIYDVQAERLLPALAPAEQRAFVALNLGRMTPLLLWTPWEGPALAEAYGLFAGWKGLLLEGLRRQTAVGRLAADPALAPDVARLQGLRAALAGWYGRAGTMPFADWRARNDSLTAAKEALERRLARALPPGALLDPLDRLGPGGLPAALPPGTAFVDVYRYDHVLVGESFEARYAAVVTSAGGAPALVDLGRADTLDALAAAWLAAVDGGAPAEAETAALLAAAWAPLAAALPAGTGRVWVAPDGALVRLPWGVLAGAHAPTAGLLVAETASARDLAALLTAPPARPGGRAVVVGGVDFGPAAAPPYAPLPGTEREADAVAALAERAGLAPVELTGAAATPAAVAAALDGAAYAHLATHGFFAAVTPEQYAAAGAGLGAVRNPLVESGLALAGANAGPEGTLTAEQLVGLDLSAARLVVLSACETGRGREVAGQGVLGLRASLAAAGARTVLMSLWSVPDESTALLMERFYRALWEDGAGPAEALRRAQAAVRTDPRFDLPVYWAAWTLAGEGW